MKIPLCAALLLLAAALGAATAEPDWPASVVCALGDPTVCTLDGCKRVPLADLDVPMLVRLDLGTGTMFALTPSTPDAGPPSR